MSKFSQFFDLNQAVSLSAGHDRMVVFARSRSGTLAHISQVDNGKACQCTCLACGEALIARQGEIREHSFAHQGGTQCKHALDAMLHAVAAALVAQHQRFVTPALHVRASVEGPHGPICDTWDHSAVQVPVERVELARHPPWKHASVMATVRGHSLLIHIALRRRAGLAKLAELSDLGQATVEIDLTDGVPKTMVELAGILFNADDRKTWLHNPKASSIAADIRNRLQPIAEQRWQEHHEAVEARKRQDEQRAAALAERERRHAAQAQVQAHAAAHLSLGNGRREEVEGMQAASPLAPRSPKPAELSPSIEYAGPTGRVWLLHSSQPDIHFRAEAGVRHELQVLCRHGAVEDNTAGVYRISRQGWSAASIELSAAWRSVRSVDSRTSGL